MSSSVFASRWTSRDILPDESGSEDILIRESDRALAAYSSAGADIWGCFFKTSAISRSDSLA